MTSQHWTNIDRLHISHCHSPNVLQTTFIAFWAFCPLWNSCKTFVLNPFKILLFQPFLSVILESDVSKCLAGRSSTDLFKWLLCARRAFSFVLIALLLFYVWTVKNEKNTRGLSCCVVAMDTLADRNHIIFQADQHSVIKNQPLDME